MTVPCHLINTYLLYLQNGVQRVYLFFITAISNIDRFSRKVNNVPYVDFIFLDAVELHLVMTVNNLANRIPLTDETFQG